MTLTRFVYRSTRYNGYTNTLEYLP